MEDFNWTDGMGAYTYYNFDEDTYHDEHGLLYNAYVIEDSSGICPINWHVPTDEEWKTLEIYLGMSDTQVNSTGWRGTDEGYKLKDIDFNGSNSSGFTALASGYRNFPSLEFDNFGEVVYLWVSSIPSSNENHYWTRVLNYGSPQINRSSHHKYHGFPIRCVQDQ
mgnify:CR=1 FL=1